MNTNTKKSGFVKALLAAALTVGAVTMAFQGLAQAVLAAEIGKEDKVVTAYPTEALLTPPESKSNAPDGYVKQAYTLVDNALEYYRDKKPTSLDLTREEAAEIGVQGLYRVFGLNMGGKVIEMAYNPAADGLRATWEGVWWINGHKRSPESDVASYSFSVDAISGELHSVFHDRVLSGQTNTGFDIKLSQNAKEFETLAREQAIRSGAIQGNVKTVEYAGQGMAGNDPEISFDITGENGQRARLQFSRYDKALLAVVYDAGVKQMEVDVINAEDFAKRAEEYFRLHPDAVSYEE